MLPAPELRDEVRPTQTIDKIDEVEFTQAFADLNDLDLTIDEETFLSPGQGDTVPQIEMWTTFGTTCWSCSDCTDCTSCPCTQVCGDSCYC